MIGQQDVQHRLRRAELPKRPSLSLNFDQESAGGNLSTSDMKARRMLVKVIGPSLQCITFRPEHQ